MENHKKKKSALTMRKTLVIFALIPMVIAATVLSTVLVVVSTQEIKTMNNHALVSLIEEIGASFDYTTENNERTMKSFIEAPIVREFLLNPENQELAQKAQEYTVNFFGTLDGWEGIYIADWNSKVLTHPAPPVVGRVMREGDRLKELQDAMLQSDGVFNVGIINSPASGKLIMSMYAPVYGEDGQPLGYVGAGTYVNSVASKISDVSSLNLESAYIYFVDNIGTMLFHPDETKIGNQVENDAVIGLIESIQKGEHPTSGCVSYTYRDVVKYAAYYVGMDEAYIAIVTVDESNVLKNINGIVVVAAILLVVCMLIIVIPTIYIAQIISRPLKSVSDSIEMLGNGDVTVECKAKSHIEETVKVIGSFQSLKSALQGSMTEVKESAGNLNSSIISVDEKTNHNVEAIEQINTAIDEVASTSQTVAENAQDMAYKASALGENIDKMNHDITQLADESLSIKQANQEATECMKSVLEGSNESVDAMKNISEMITETNSALADIGKAIQAIEEIASQTNLLSLNASIEAARAGESGRGFAVVADEIRSLADSSSVTANEIKKVIDNIMGLSNGTVEISERVNHLIRREQEEIKSAQNKFDILSESVEASISGIDTIRRMANELDAFKNDMSRSTEELGSISEELGATAQEVAANCQMVVSACSETQESTKEMRLINEKMISSIEYFRI